MIDPLELIDPKPYRDRPTSCPKCSHDDVHPHYLEAHTGPTAVNPVSYTWPEQLVWHCRRCGWKTTTACADVDDDQAPVDECGGGDLPKEARP